MIENFNSFGSNSSLNENEQQSIGKLKNFIEKDNEVRVAIQAAIAKAGKDLIHMFLYDLSDDSDLKDYNNTKNRARSIIAKSKKRDAEKSAREAKIELVEKEREKRAEVERVLSKKLGADNYRLLSKKLHQKDLYIVYDIVNLKRNKSNNTKLPASKIELLKSLSKFDIKDEDIENIINIIQKN